MLARIDHICDKLMLFYNVLLVVVMLNMDIIMPKVLSKRRKSYAPKAKTGPSSSRHVWQFAIVAISLYVYPLVL